MVIGIITKEQFFKLMKAAHDVLWKLNTWTVKRTDREMIDKMAEYYILLIAGMDSELATYLHGFLLKYEELNIDQLDMLYDYLAGDEINEN